MPLVTADQARQKIETDLADDDLQTILDQEEAELVDKFGTIPDGSTSVTEIHEGGLQNVYLRWPISSVTSVTEASTLGGTATTLTANTHYYSHLRQGRIQRLAEGNRWNRLVTVTYIPQDLRDRVRIALIEIVRIALAQTPMNSESIAGEYSYSAGNFEALRAAQYRKLAFGRL